MKVRAMLVTLGLLLTASAVYGDPLNCDMGAYKEVSGLSAKVANNALAVAWDGDNGSQLRMSLAINSGTPTISELAVRPKGGKWSTVATNVTPEFRVVAGLRRISAQQLRPDSIKALGGTVTPEIQNAWDHQDEMGDEWVNIAVRTGQIKKEDVERWKWEAFWDAPLYVEGSGDRGPNHGTSIPPVKGIFDQPGLPRTPSEISRVTASYHADGCTVKTDGARLEIVFPGVDAGVFTGHLQYDVFQGTNLIRQVLVATTEEPSVAFKFDGGLNGLPVGDNSRVVWRDLGGGWQENQFGSSVSNGPATVWSSNRVIAAELPGGSIAAFPPPHSFYWARESEQNLGASWYRKDDESTFSFGQRQAEQEEDPEFFHNFALYSARPGKEQLMPVFLYVSPHGGHEVIDEALAFTNHDHFKALPGYKVMGTHYHVDFVRRLRESGSLDNRLNDIEAIKGVGINIFTIIDGPERAKGLEGLAEYYDAARRQSDKDFLVMPAEENIGINLGGHSDLWLSKPTYYLPKRAKGQPLVEQDPKYGKVYHLGGPMDLMEMTEEENALVFMPHPRSKGSTGYPDAIKDAPQFLHDNYRGFGYRWGMGIDASETRLCEYRCLDLWDEVNNWMVSEAGSPKLKFFEAISEARSNFGLRGKPPYDDTYGMAPVNYVKIDEVPTVDDMSPIINAVKNGEYFVTSGEVLIPEYSVEGSGDHRTIKAEVQWTFPLNFVEVVWGDGKTTDRKIISTTDLPAFGKKTFEIPFDASGKKWVRFAAWDVATNGAFVQPIKLN